MSATLRVAGRLFNTPLLLLPETAAVIATNLSARFDVEPMLSPDAPTVEASRFRGTPVPTSDGRVAYRVEDRVAIVPVMGELVNRGAWIGASSGLTSYEGLDAALRAAAADAGVRGIVLDMNTPGGEAAGAMEAGALVRTIGHQKPVVAFVNGLAASAGYAIAAGATRIVTIASGGLGSIGVVMLHLDRSAALERAGVKPTLIHAGAHKVDGHGFAALPDAARARIQGQIEGLYDLFVRSVASHRRLPEAAVRGTEADMFMGAKAVAAGLADEVRTIDDALVAAGGSRSHAARDAGSVPAQLRAPLPSIQDSAPTDERHRLKAILSLSDEPEMRDFLMALAFDTDLSVAFAKSLVGMNAADRAKQAPAAADPAGHHRRRLCAEPDTSSSVAKKASAPWPEVVRHVEQERGNR